MDSERRHSKEVPVEPLAMSGDTVLDQEDGEVPPSGIALETAHKAQEQSLNDPNVPGENRMRDEIEAVQQLLQKYGFSFFDLTECSPKAAKTKSACAEAVRALMASEELLKSMREKLKLPMKALSEKSGVSMKVLEHHRRYIIAAAEILNGEYPLLASYMDYIRKGMT